MTNIALGVSENVLVLIEARAISKLVHLLSSCSNDVREQVMWELGNIADDYSSH